MCFIHACISDLVFRKSFSEELLQIRLHQFFTFKTITKPANSSIALLLSLENKLILLHLFKKQLCWNLLKLLFRINTSQACVGGAIYSAMMGKEKKNTITKQISHYSTMILSCQTFHCWKTLSKKLIKADRFMKFVTLP